MLKHENIKLYERKEKSQQLRNVKKIKPRNVKKIKPKMGKNSAEKYF